MSDSDAESDSPGTKLRPNMSRSPSNDSSSPTSGLGTKNKRRLGGARKAASPVLTTWCTEDELADRALSAAWNQLSAEVVFSRIPHHLLVPFRDQTLRKLAQVDRKAILCAGSKSRFSCAEVGSCFKSDVAAFAKGLAQPAPARRFVDISIGIDRGTRPTMEDKIQVISHIGNLLLDAGSSQRQPAPEPTLRSGQFEEWVRAVQVFAAVYDGHNGKEAAVFAKEHMHHFLAKAASYPGDVSNSLRQAFAATNDAFLRRAEADNCGAGTTATVAVVLGREFHLANVGDSSAYLYSTNLAEAPLQLTELHNVDNEAEAAAVKKRGGKISLVQGIARVNGSIRVTRTLGYLEAKDSMSAEPHIIHRTLQATDDFVVLASDGIWDVMTPKEVGEFVHRCKAEVHRNLARSGLLNNSRNGSNDAAPESNSSSPPENSAEKTIRERTKGRNPMRVAFDCASSDSSADESMDDNPDPPDLDYFYISEALTTLAKERGSSDNITVVTLFFNQPNSVFATVAAHSPEQP
ncbi:Protein phosphatase 2C-like protein 3 [Diplonema papillatum]|nr:Protein phosphatase 2C-like protein 3 [Diplonema papillatum]|eukprot:gene12598-19514_t